MESRSLAHMIQQLQNEIRKLETENKKLRGQISPQIRTAEPIANVTDGRNREQENQLHGNLRRNVSAPALEGQYKGHIMMTVRRYSISSNAIHVHQKSTSDSCKAPSDCDSLCVNAWSRQQSEEQGLSHMPTEERDVAKPTTRRLLEQRLSKARSKEKTVTFLLPVDDIYTNRPISASHLSDKSSCDLSEIPDTDS